MGTSLMVIGGSGFFGKSILDARARGLLRPWDIDRIIVVARHADALLREHPALVGDQVTLLNADVGTTSALPFADYVIHAASSTDARRYAAFPQEERANILASIDNYCRIAEAAHRDSRILYTSSGAVYGQQPAVLERVDEDYVPGAVDELVAYKRDYAEAKRLAEARIARLGERGHRVSVARCFAFVGLHLPRDQHFAIGNFLADGLAGRPVRVQATRPVYRSYLHADDLVRWLMTIVHAATPACSVVNVGSDEARTMGEVAHAVAARCGVEAVVPEITSAEVDRYVPSIERARAHFGLTVELDLAAAIDAVVGRAATKERGAGRINLVTGAQP